MRSPINDSRPTKSRQRCPFSHPCAKGGMAALALFSSLRCEGGGRRDECRFAAGTRTVNGPTRKLSTKAPGHFQSHTAFSGVSFLRSRDGQTYCILHADKPSAAAPQRPARAPVQRPGIGRASPAGQRRSSARESVRRGQRPDGDTVSGTINMLCSDRYTDIGESATYQSTWLDIAAWEDRVR